MTADQTHEKHPTETVEPSKAAEVKPAEKTLPTAPELPPKKVKKDKYDYSEDNEEVYGEKIVSFAQK